MNHAQKLNNLIQISSDRENFKSVGFRSFEKENLTSLVRNPKAENLFFSSSVLGLEAISHVIEDQAINLGGKFSFYADFQKFSRMRPQEERYRKLCTSGNPIFIFGIPDTRPVFSHINLKEIELDNPVSFEEPNLAHNWFVVLNNPKFVSMALVANELPKPQFTTSHSYQNKLIYRNFEGFWTYDQTVIDEIVNIFEDYIKTKSPQAINTAGSVEREKIDTNQPRRLFKVFGR